MPTPFFELDLLPSIQGTLAAQGFEITTEVQHLALPVLLDRRSVVAVAETGSGKTLGYLLPILDRLARMEQAGNRVDEPAEPRALILVPTRELGEQVAKVLKSFTHDTRLRVRTALGGMKSRKIRENVSGMFEVLIATPGRLRQLLDRSDVSLDALRFVVLDEADELLDMGFGPEVVDIIGRAPGQRQLALFSATMSPELEVFVTDAFADAVQVRTEGSQQLVPTLRTLRIDVPNGRRDHILPGLLQEPTEGGTMLFGNTRAQCDRIATWVRAAGAPCAVVRGDMDGTERRKNLRAFRDGEVPFLVVTDLAARGLDIPHVGRVINVHMPHTMQTYLHRVGRTARAGREGWVVNLVTPRDEAFAKEVERAGEATAG